MNFFHLKKNKMHIIGISKEYHSTAGYWLFHTNLRL